MGNRGRFSGGQKNRGSKQRKINNGRSLSDVLGGGRKTTDEETRPPAGKPGIQSSFRRSPAGGAAAWRSESAVAARNAANPSKGKISPKRGGHGATNSDSKSTRGRDRDEWVDPASTARGPKSSRGTGRGTQRSTHTSARGENPADAGATHPRSDRPGRRSKKRGAPSEHEFRGGPTSSKTDRPSRGAPERSPRSDRSARPERHQRIQKPKSGTSLVEGVIKRHPDGFGFLIPAEQGHLDVYIPRHHMTGVMTNDSVVVEVYEGREKDRLFGEVVEIKKRAVKQIVGRYLPVDVKYGVIQDDGKGWGTDLRILSSESMNAKEGDLVAVEILSYPTKGQEFTGKVISIIGNIDDPLNDVRRVIFGHHIPHEFSATALAEARRHGGKVNENEIRTRKDIRGKSLITIDGATARDFDDAIYVEQHDRGFHLWVAIADVSYYVKPGTKLDEEAFERGTSTYFPNFVVPMLPEELSNELCSLKPKVPRLCFCCEMHLDFHGNVESYEFYEAVMESKARVTYGEAQEVIDGSCPDRLQQVKENILRAGDLAKILMAKRFREGSLDLEIPETQVVVDDSGEAVDIIRSERLFAHRLIEELMLVTNICTARFMEENGVPGIYRIHEPPKADNLKVLERYLWNFGGKRSLQGEGLQRKITQALQAFDGRPEHQILNILTLRTMNLAKYSNENLGHFGLGFSHYSHFTSPIRRYPDLIAHRQIKSLLYPDYGRAQMGPEEVATAATMCSACEQRSVKAERQLISIKKARFIARFKGEEFEGVISSVAKFGIFVLLRSYDVDGLVKVEMLGDDRWIFDDENLRLIGKRSNRQYAIGDTIKVQVAAVDPEAGRIDFVLAGTDMEQEPQRAMDASFKANSKNTAKRSKNADDRGGVRKVRVPGRRRKNKAGKVRS